MVRDGSLSDPPCETLVADFSARGVWQPQATALFDVRVIDTDAPSYINKTPVNVLKIAEREKKQKYGRACEARIGLLVIDPFPLITREQKHGLKRHKYQKIEQGKGYNMV